MIFRNGNNRLGAWCALRTGNALTRNNILPASTSIEFQTFKHTRIHVTRNHTTISKTIPQTPSYLNFSTARIIYKLNICMMLRCRGFEQLYKKRALCLISSSTKNKVGSPPAGTGNNSIGPFFQGRNPTAARTHPTPTKKNSN